MTPLKKGPKVIAGRTTPDIMMKSKPNQNNAVKKFNFVSIGGFSRAELDKYLKITQAVCDCIVSFNHPIVRQL